MSDRLPSYVVGQRFLQWVVIKLKCGFPRLKGLGKRFLTHTHEPIRRSIFCEGIVDQHYEEQERPKSMKIRVAIGCSRRLR
jgi:hypothetical protein